MINTWQAPWTFADMFDALVRHNLPDELQDWDSISHDNVEAAESWDACKQSCEDNGECFQFVFDGEQCGLGNSIHLGQRKDPEGSKKWRSGWLKSKIEEWVSKQPACSPSFPVTGWLDR